MSHFDPTGEEVRAAEREQRLHQAAAARQMAKEAKASDHDYNTDDQRHSAFGRLLSWLGRSGPGG